MSMMPELSQLAAFPTGDISAAVGQFVRGHVCEEPRLETALQQAFGIPFLMWQQSPVWRPLYTPNGNTARTSDSDKALLSEEAQPLIIELCQQLWPASAFGDEVRGPQHAHMMFRDGYLVAYRDPDAADLPSVWVGWAKWPQVAVKNMLRQIELQQRQQGVIHTLRNENLELAEHICESLEELALLRQLVGRLGQTEFGGDWDTWAEAVLPVLCESVSAESLALVVEDKSRNGSSLRVASKFGNPAQDDSVYMNVVQQFGEGAEAIPFVRNRWHETNDACRPESVRDLVIVSIARGTGIGGWLVAANRCWNSNHSDASACRLSQFEFGTVEATLLEAATALLSTQTRQVELFRENKRLLVNLVRALVSAIEAKDRHTHGHSERVAIFARRLAEEAGLTRYRCERIYLGGLLHDIGKIGVSDATLQKTGSLTPEEIAEIKTHPVVGWSILHEIEPLEDILPIVVYHHERFDGGGYPEGLDAEEIPLEARILAVADAFDAMTSNRPYRHGMTVERAQEILHLGAGSQWDARLVELFCAIMPEILELRAAYTHENENAGTLIERQRLKSGLPLPAQDHSPLPASPEAAAMLGK